MTTRPASTWARLARRPEPLALLFIGSGIAHFRATAAYAQVIPTILLPSANSLVLVSGAAEVFGGVGLLVPAARRWAGIGLIVLLVVIFPANVQMLVNAKAANAPGWQELLLWVRLPLQLVMIFWVRRVALEERGGSSEEREVPIAN